VRGHLSAFAEPIANQQRKIQQLLRAVQRSSAADGDRGAEAGSSGAGGSSGAVNGEGAIRRSASVPGNTSAWADGRSSPALAVASGAAGGVPSPLPAWLPD
jgi:hypothetical protein